MPDPITRFSRTVENYILYRPDYPAELLAMMKNELGLSPGSIVADIGSGTGKLTSLFLENGNTVFAVEPNREMREAAERLLGHHPRFHSVGGTAEATGLPDGCADFVTAAQAFHWFDPEATKREFLRILKPDAWVLLVWNDRNDDNSAFMRDYDAFLRRFSTDLDKIDHRHIGDEQMALFFGKNGHTYRAFDWCQPFDFDGVKGRYLSCSYAFDETHPRHEAAMTALRATFDAHAENGEIGMWYSTRAYFGCLA